MSDRPAGHPLRALLLVPALLLLSAAARLPAQETGQAGAAREDITPESSIRLSGYGGRTAPSEGVEDRLFARALALKDPEGVLTVLVSVDSIGVPSWVREEVVGAIRDRLKVYHTRLAVSSTHTHTGPQLSGALENLLVMTPGETEAVRTYTGFLIRRMVKAIDRAIQGMAPATLHHGKGTAGFAKNRRTAGGPVDHELPVLVAKDLSGKPIAVVFNYACHATTLGGEFNRVSCDWPGYAASFIEESQPGAVALPFIGCGADANPDPRGQLSQAQAHGREIARAVAGVLAGGLTPLPPRIDAQLEYVNLRFAEPPARAQLEERAKTGAPHVRRNARRQLERLDRGESLPRTLPYPIQILDFGKDLTMVLLAGEVVVDYAIRLRRELAPRNLWVTAYANDVPCYIASRRVLSEGGYEVDDSMVWYDRPGRWDPSVEDAIVEKVRALAGASSAQGSAGKRVKPPGPLSPREAQASFRLPEGFGIELAAAEPEVTDPVAIAFDESGRMYAAEMRDYPRGPGEGKPFDGRIRRLDDRDLDGYYEHSTVFAENVPFPTGVICSKGGVYVTCAPDLIFLKDEDDDGRAEVRKVVFTGFNVGNSQHLLNTLKRGLDNWIYVNGGDSADVRSPEDPARSIVSGAGVSFRFDPLNHRIEIESGYRGGFGIGFDRHGERFVCDNQSHALQVVLPRRYLARNPDLRIEETVKELTVHGAKVYPVSKPLERFNDPWDAGRFSSACGVHVYGGDALPEAYRGSHFACEPVSNLVHRDVLVPAGATFIARRSENEKESEFLASTDHWFRPVSADTGPDGALYIVDMYREVIEHPQWIPEHMQKLFDLRSGMDRGRIWRVYHGKPPERWRPDLARAPIETLVERLSHPNAWQRETAQRLLVERGDPQVEALLQAETYKSSNPLGRLHALWTLEGLKKSNPFRLIGVLQQDSYPALRAAAATLAEPLLEAPPAGVAPKVMEVLKAHVIVLARDRDPKVRFQAALSLGSLPPADRIPPLIKIAIEDSADPWTRAAILTSLSCDPTPVLEAAAKRAPPRDGDREMIESLSALVGARGRPEEARKSILILLDGERAAGTNPAVIALLSALGAEKIEEALQGTEGEAARARLSGLFTRAAERAADESLGLADRKSAIDLLAFDASPGTLPVLKAFLGPRHPGEVQRAAVRSLSRLPGRETRREVTSLLVGGFAAQTPAVRSETLEALLEDRERTTALLDAIESGDIRAEEVDLGKRNLLLGGLEKESRDRAEKLFAGLKADPDRARVVERYRAEIGASRGGDGKKGEELFLKHCSTCHKAGERGAAVGADLSGMRARSVDALIEDILDPSRAVAPAYVNYSLFARDGRVLAGILAAETPSSVTLKAAEGKTESVLRRDIADLRSTNRSLMPEGLEKELSPADLGDLIAFVRGGLISAEGAAPRETALARLREALTFHAPFDSTADAAFARGDPKIHTAPELLKPGGRPGLESPHVAIAPGKGRHGGALEFRKKEKPAVYFPGGENLAYRKTGWSGTVSLWLSLDPDQDLEPGFADPIQITEREWNDAAFFVDFSKDDRPRHFRLGAFADRVVWDPKRRDWDAVPAEERPLVDVPRKVFARGKWTHVAFTFSGFNTGKEDGVATLYIDGAPAGSLSKRRQSFTWDPARASIWLGLSYIGLMDDLAIFDRELSAEEVRVLHGLDGGVKALGKQST